MFLPTLVSHLSHLYLITVLLIPVVGIIASVFQTQDDDDDDTTDDGVDDYTDGGDDDYTAGDFFSKTESTMRLLMINQTISFVIGGFANLITLLAIPYVRLYYGSQFSVLQLNSVVLILHLSMADLLCSVLGAPNIILVFLRKKSLITENFCYYVGLLRYLGANLDFLLLCWTPEISRSKFRFQHHSHDILLCGQAQPVQGVFWCLPGP